MHVQATPGNMYGSTPRSWRVFEMPICTAVRCTRHCCCPPSTASTANPAQKIVQYSGCISQKPVGKVSKSSAAVHLCACLAAGFRLCSTCWVMNISKKEGRLESASRADDTSMSMVNDRLPKPQKNTGRPIGLFSWLVVWSGHRTGPLNSGLQWRRTGSRFNYVVFLCFYLPHWHRLLQWNSYL